MVNLHDGRVLRSKYIHRNTQWPFSYSLYQLHPLISFLLEQCPSRLSVVAPGKSNVEVMKKTLRASAGDIECVELSVRSAVPQFSDGTGLFWAGWTCGIDCKSLVRRSLFRFFSSADCIPVDL